MSVFFVDKQKMAADDLNTAVDVPTKACLMNAMNAKALYTLAINATAAHTVILEANGLATAIWHEFSDKLHLNRRYFDFKNLNLNVYF